MNVNELSQEQCDKLLTEQYEGLRNTFGHGACPAGGPRGAPRRCWNVDVMGDSKHGDCQGCGWVPNTTESKVIEAIGRSIIVYPPNLVRRDLWLVIVPTSDSEECDPKGEGETFKLALSRAVVKRMLDAGEEMP